MPYETKLVKMNGKFGPAEIQIKKNILAGFTFQVKLEHLAPHEG